MPESHPLTIHTERLRLVAATKRLAMADRTKLSRLLRADILQAWPPALLTEVEPVWAERLAADPDLAGWLHWFIVLVDEEGDEDVLIGCAGFNGLDEETGTLLLGFALLTIFQNQGYATEAADALTAWAFDRPDVRRVAARTFPDLVASRRVLEKIGMGLVNDPRDPYHEAVGADAGALLFAIARQEFIESRNASEDRSAREIAT